MTHFDRIVVALLMTVALQGHTVALEPFVSGFDRFARHDEIDSAVAGHLLISELSCTACHASQDASLTPKRGPRLDDAGTRLHANWVRTFLVSPHTAKPGTTMPDVLVGKSEQERATIAQELTAFLMSQTKPLPIVKASGTNPVPFEFWKKGDASSGKTLYHQVGCVACHQADESVEISQTDDSQLSRLLDELDPEELADMGLAGAARQVKSVPLSELAAKYSPQSLTFFLIDPLKTRPAGRMPNLKLKAIEAADIAAYLQREGVKSTQDTMRQAAPEFDETMIQRGRHAFGSLGCIQCHDASGIESIAYAKPLHELEPSREGCLDGKRINYMLDVQQIGAIRDAISAAKQSSAAKPNVKPDAVQQLNLTMLQFNCFGCHQRDGKGGVGRYRTDYFHSVGDIDLGDEGRLPPPLDHVGGKLTKSHLTNVLLGKKADVRPHMHIRMPAFPADGVEPLPGLFAKIDEADASTATEVFGVTKNTEDVGRELMDVGCVQCHAFRGHALPGVVGVDLQDIHQRVRPRWFHDFLLDPGSLKSRTRMPTFFPDGKSQHPLLYDGDPTRQIGAMWAYLTDLPQQSLPEKIEQARSQNYELVPTEQPIVLRTFIQDVGMHAIAVGFPEKVHYVFDTESGSLAVGWRGRFLDAQGTWFIRFSPPAVPLGDHLIAVPGALFDPTIGTYRFKGYRLDSERVPTFLYDVGDFQVSDRIVPDSKDGLQRTIHIQSQQKADLSQTIWLNVLAGTSLKKERDNSYTNDRGLTVLMTDPLVDSGRLHDQDGQQTWSVPLRLIDNASIQVNYAW